MARRRTQNELTTQRSRAVKTLNYLNTRNQIKGNDTNRGQQLSSRYYAITRRYGNASVAKGLSNG